MSDDNRSNQISFIGAGLAVILGLYLSSRYSYLFFHALVEFASIAISFTLFIITWNTRRFLVNGCLKILGIGYGVIAGIDLLHTLAYKGMGVFPGYDANLPTQLWIAARALQAVLLCVAPLFARRKADEKVILAICLAVVGVATALVYSGAFPDCFIEGKGLTPFKIISEYIISAFFLAAILLFVGQRSAFNTRVFSLIVISIICTIGSELAFTSYASVYGLANMIGHFLKLASFYLLYRAVIFTGFKEPFELIFRDLKLAEEAGSQEREFNRSLLENMADGVVACDAQGILNLFNRTARNWHGVDLMRLPQEEWAKLYDLFRVDGVTPLPTEEIPLVMAFRGEEVRDVGMAIVAKGRNPRYILANGSSIMDTEGRKLGAVVSMRDITEFRLLEQELRRANEDLEQQVAARTAALKKSAKDLKEAQRIGHIGSWNLDLTTNVLSWSDEIYRIFEIDPVKFGASYEAFLDAIHPDDREMVNKAYTDSLKNKKPYSIDHRLLFADGRIKYVHEQCETLWENGRSLLSIGTVQDITERKLAEQERQANLKFYESLDLVNRAIQEETQQLEEMMSKVLDVILTVLDCDRAFLMYPCDPEAERWQVPMERTKPEYPGALAQGAEMPMDSEIAETLRIILAADGPVKFGPGTNHPLPVAVSKRFGFKCFMSMAIYPTDDNPWQFGVHQCSFAREWTLEEERLFQEIGRRLADALTSMLMYRNRQESERRFSTLINQAADGFFVHDMEGRILDVNQRACESLGYTRDELLAMNVAEVDAEFFTHDHAKKFWSQLTLNHPVTLQGRHKRKDGTTFPVEVRLGLLQLEDRHVILGLARDITERKAAEQKLREQSEFLQNSLDALTHSFYVINAHDYTIAMANKASNFGEYQSGVTCYQMTHDRNEPCSGNDHPCALVEIIKSKSPVVLEHLHYDEAGNKKYMEIHGYPVFDADGEVEQIIEYCIDISARKQEDDERRRLTTVIEQAADSIVITDTSGIIQYVNPSFESITGYSREETIGQNPRILKSGEHSVQFYQEMWDTLTCGNVWRGHLINRKKDGSLFQEEASITPVRNEAGKIINYVALKRDVTKQQELEEHLQQAQKMEALGTLAGGIAHDFNNILAAILGYAEMVRDELTDGSDVRRMQQEVINAGNRAKDLAKQILTFSRKGPEETRPVQVHLIVNEALKLLHSSIPSTITLTERINPKAGMVMADPTQLHQIVMNLSTNAYQAMRKSGGELTVSLDCLQLEQNDSIVTTSILSPGTYVKLEISDTGMGMDQQTLDKIFEPYFTTKEKGEGTGLGLAIVHGIVESCKGHISVSSQRGRGTTFQIYLPQISMQPTAVSAKSHEYPRGSEQIILVDDEKTIAEMLAMMLKGLGYQVHLYTSSKELLQAFHQRPEAFDLVITDMTMPEMNGKELGRELMAIRPDIPIILCTGFSELIDKEQAEAVGIKEYLIKPVSKSDLAGVVRKVLDGERLKSY